MTAQTKKPEPDQNWKVSWDTLQWVNEECRKWTKLHRRKFSQREFGDMIRAKYAVLSRTPSTFPDQRDKIFSVPADTFLTEDVANAVSLLTQERREEYHRWLDEILESAIAGVVVGIVANLEWGSTATRLRKGKNLEEPEGSGNKAISTGQTPQRHEPGTPGKIERAVRSAIGTKQRDKPRTA